MREILSRLTCDRCNATIHEEKTDDTEGEKSCIGIDVSGTIVSDASGVSGDQFSYTDLCGKCSIRLRSLIEDMVKTGKGRSTPRKKKKVSVTKNTSATA